MTRIDAAFPTLLASLEKRDAQDTPALYEWYRENSDHVLARVHPDGTISMLLNGTRQEDVLADDYATACAAVEDLMNKETVR